MSFSGKWLATVNGAGLVASIALIITAYTSLAGASNMCLASGFVSHTIEVGQDVGRMFLVGGLLSLLVYATPGLTGFVRNMWRAEGSQPQPPLDLGEELFGLSSWLVWVMLVGQTVLLCWCIVSFTLPALHTALDRRAYTQERIQQRLWRDFDDGCKPSFPDLT